MKWYQFLCVNTRTTLSEGPTSRTLTLRTPLGNPAVPRGSTTYFKNYWSAPYSVQLYDEWWIMNWKGFGRKLSRSIQVLSRKFLAGTEGNHRRSGWPASWPTFEPSTSRIRVHSVATYSKQLGSHQSDRPAGLSCVSSVVKLWAHQNSILEHVTPFRRREFTR
jgi:hypothetical protein